MMLQRSCVGCKQYGVVLWQKKPGFYLFFLAYTPKIASQVLEENVNVGTWKFELGTSGVAPSLYLGCILSDIYSL